jgi:hypothetical protein
MRRILLVFLMAAAAFCLIMSAITNVAGAQTVAPPPGMILVDCPVRPAPWEAPVAERHAGWDLNLDPSAALSIARGVPASCIAYPGDREDIYRKIIGLRVYIPRHGTDPGSTTGAMATAVAIRDNNAGTWNTTEQEFWQTGQNWRDWVSPDGRWVYSVRGGLITDPTSPRYCDVATQSDWRRWPVLVQERDLLGCLDRIWARGGTLGMPSTPTAAPTVVTQATQVPTVQALVVAPSPTPNPLEKRLTELERRQAEDRSLLERILEVVTQP